MVTTTQINVIAVKANKPGVHKISIERANLLAFAEISLFKCIFGKEKTKFGIAMKKCGMRDSRKKGAGMRDQDPLPDPDNELGRMFAVKRHVKPLSLISLRISSSIKISTHLGQSYNH